MPVVNGVIAAAANPYDLTTNPFNTIFQYYVNNETGNETDNLHYEARVTYYDISIKSTWSLLLAANRNLTGVEHPVRVTEWVIDNNQVPGSVTTNPVLSWWRCSYGGIKR